MSGVTKADPQLGHRAFHLIQKFKEATTGPPHLRASRNWVQRALGSVTEYSSNEGLYGLPMSGFVFCFFMLTPGKSWRHNFGVYF